MLIDGNDVALRQCGVDIRPRLCTHAYVHGSPASKPCRPKDLDSYLSSTSTYAIEQHLPRGTAVDKWTFRLRYEFVTIDDFSPLAAAPAGANRSRVDEDAATAAAVEGPFPEDIASEKRGVVNDCYQVISSRQGNGSVTSPRNTLLYGRGGQANLRCLYRFVSEEHETVHLTIHRFHEQCKNTDSLDDLGAASDPACRSCLSVHQVLFDGIERPLYSACRSQNQVVTLNSSAGILQLWFDIEAMTWAQDDDHFFFIAEYHFSSGAPAHCWPEHRQVAKRGEVFFRQSDPCSQVPWYLASNRPGNEILLNLPNNLIALDPMAPVVPCPTENRLLVYSIDFLQYLGHNLTRSKLYRILCLQHGKDAQTTRSGSTTESSASGWGGSGLSQLYSPGYYQRHRRQTHALLIVPSANSLPAGDQVTVAWLSVYPDNRRLRHHWPVPDPTKILITGGGAWGNQSQLTNILCPTSCIPLSTCLSHDLWCDDQKDCPDGSDEAQCIRFVNWPLYLGLAVMILVALTAGLVYYAISRYYQANKYHLAQGRHHYPKRLDQDDHHHFSSMTVCLTQAYDKSGPGS